MKYLILHLIKLVQIGAVLIVPVLQTFKTSTESVLVFDTKVNESMFCDSEKPMRISSCCAF